MTQTAWIVRWVIALTLAVAAGLKIGGHPDPDSILGSMPPALQWAAVAVELALAAWLVSGALPRPAAYAALVVFSVFLATLLINMNSAHPRDCGCLGKVVITQDAGKNRQIMLGLDIGMLALAMAAYYLPSPRRAGS